MTSPFSISEQKAVAESQAPIQIQSSLLLLVEDQFQLRVLHPRCCASPPEIKFLFVFASSAFRFGAYGGRGYEMKQETMRHLRRTYGPSVLL